MLCASIAAIADIFSAAIVMGRIQNDCLTRPQNIVVTIGKLPFRSPTFQRKQVSHE